MSDRKFQLTGINQAIAQKLVDEHDLHFLGTEEDWPADWDVSDEVFVRDWRVAIHDAGCCIELRCEGHVFDCLFDEREVDETEKRDRLASLVAALIAEQEADQLVLFS